MNEPPKDLLLIVKYLIGVATVSNPQAFKAFLLGGVLTNVIAALPESYFEEMLKVEPCGRQGCDCLLGDLAAKFLQLIREDHQRHAGMLHSDE